MSSSFSLAGSDLVAFSATTDALRCRAFYEGKLGLKFISDDPYGIVFDSGGTHIRIQKGPELTPVPRTVLGWKVKDISEAIRQLATVGIAMERYTWFKQSEEGCAEFPDGTRVAWFKDPDGNILSLSQTRA
jgi:catechol 2,3-dioxygenase-like lactoylglutathione lyase family enzyme